MDNENQNNNGIVAGILTQIEKARIDEVRKSAKPRIQAILDQKKKIKDETQKLNDLITELEEFLKDNGVANQNDLNKIMNG